MGLRNCILLRKPDKQEDLLNRKHPRYPLDFDLGSCVIKESDFIDQTDFLALLANCLWRDAAAGFSMDISIWRTGLSRFTFCTSHRSGPLSNGNRVLLGGLISSLDHVPLGRATHHSMSLVTVIRISCWPGNNACRKRYEILRSSMGICTNRCFGSIEKTSCYKIQTEVGSGQHYDDAQPDFAFFTRSDVPKSRAVTQWRPTKGRPSVQDR